MNEQKLSSLSIEISELARSIKVYFKNQESLQDNINQLNHFEQRLIGINKDLQAQDSTINKILISIKDATENITSTSLNTVKATAKFGLEGVAIATKIGGVVGGTVAGNAVGKAVGIDWLSELAGLLIEQPLSSLGENISNLSEKIKIISKEQKISEKEAFKQIVIAFSLKIEQITIQCSNLKQFLNKTITDDLLFQKITTPSFPKLETIEKEVEHLTQEIKQDFRLREIEVMKNQFEQIENAQARLIQIEKILLSIVENLRNRIDECLVLDSEAMENLLTFLNQEIIYIRICPIQGISLCLTGREETIKDIDNRFNQIHQNVKKLIPESNRRYERAKNILCKANRRKEAYKDRDRGKEISKQKLTSVSKKNYEPSNAASRKQVSEAKNNSPLPILMWLIILAFCSWIGWNFFNSKQVQNKTEQLLLEVRDIDKNSDIPSLKNYQEKIKKSILMLETIPDAPGSDYKKIKNNIINLQSKLNTVEQKIKASNQLSEQANKDLEAAQRLAMEASIIVQNPPHPLEIWQQAQAKWQESIKLLEAIPENLPAYVQAQEKLVTYQTNYAALTKRVEIEQNASNTITTIEDLAKQSVELVQDTPYTIEVLKNAQEKLKEAMNLLKSIPSGTAASAKAESLMRVYGDNSKAIQSKIEQLEFCKRLNMTSCTDAEIQLNLK
jgi:hypothetical protein